MPKKISIAPLSGSFMVTSIVGLLISIIFVFQLSPTWGTALAIFFIIMLVAALISMTRAPVSESEFKSKK